jgi:hypothetical protein
VQVSLRISSACSKKCVFVVTVGDVVVATFHAGEGGIGAVPSGGFFTSGTGVAGIAAKPVAPAVVEASGRRAEDGAGAGAGAGDPGE